MSFRLTEQLIAMRDDLQQMLRQQPFRESTRLTHKLHRVEASLDRIATGNFGRCQNCQNLIDSQRLHNLPYAELCFKCQRQLEK